MNKFLERLEKIKHIDTYFWCFIALVFIVALKVGKVHYEKEKRYQHDIFMLKSQLYRDSSECFIDSARLYEHDWKYAGQAMYYEARANEMADSAKYILNQ